MHDAKKILKKIWWFIWEDESIWSWIVNIILAFVLIKFIIYPGLGFLLGTTHPVVAVVSGSMEHDGDFDGWWNDQCKINGVLFSQEELYADQGITRNMFLDFPFKNGFNTGDLMVLKSRKNLKLGDIIVFQPKDQVEPIIHRIVVVEEKEGTSYFTTKGDHNCGSSSSEYEISEQEVIGEATFRIPFLGMVKLGFVKLLQLFGVR